MSSLKVTQITPRHSRGTTFVGESGSTTHFHPHSRVILHEYATKDWILEVLGDLEGADLSELVTKKYAHETFGEIYLGKEQPIGVKVTDLWYDTSTGDERLKMCSKLDHDENGAVVKQHWINVAPRPVDINASSPVSPVDGDLWYDNNEDTMQLQVYHQDSGAWIAAAPPSTIEGRVTSGEALQAEIGQAVVDLQSGKLSKNGDTMSGTYTATKGNRLKFSAKDANDKGKTFVDIVNTDGNGTDGVDYKMHLYHVATPTAPYHAANQKYVDDAVGLGTSGILSEDDIKSLIEEAIASPSAAQHAANLQPPGVKFTYQSGSSGLTEKHFQLWEDGSNKRIRISTKGVDIDWHDQGITTDYAMDNGPYFSIYFQPSISSANDRVKWRQRRTGRINRIDWHTDDILLYITSWHSYGSLSEEADYFITIGGIL